MTRRAPNESQPLVNWPIEEIVEFARSAGRRAFSDPDVILAAYLDVRFQWIAEAFPSGRGMTDEEFEDIIVRACKAFDDGVGEYVDSLSRLADSAKRRLPAVSYFFSEDNSFQFGLQVDLSEFRVESFNADDLYERFYQRLLAEYDRLTPHIEAAKHEPDAYQTDDDDIPLQLDIQTSGALVLRIVPAAIARDILVLELPGYVKDFVRLLSQAQNMCHE